MGKDIIKKSKRNREKVLRLGVDNNWFKRKNWDNQQIWYKKCYLRRSYSFLKTEWNLDCWIVESYKGVRFRRFDRVQSSNCEFEKRCSRSEFLVTWLKIFYELTIFDCIIAERLISWIKGWLRSSEELNWVIKRWIIQY